MNNTYSDLSSMLPSYSSNGSHAPPPAKLPLGKPGSRVFDTHSTCSEDGGTTSKKDLDTTRKVAPVAGTIVALQAAAAKIYGQPGFPACSTLPTGPSPESDDPNDIDRYAQRLAMLLQGAWAAARDDSVDAQVADMNRKATPTSAATFQFGQSVCRLLPDHVNKLQWQWSGPYRVSEVLPDGNYRLQDLENKLLHDPFLHPRVV